MPRFDITIAGELNLDLILYGLPDELPPERELLADRMMLTLGSSSAICAHNLAALGSKVGFQSLIGDDSLGTIALQRLADGGVDVSRVRQVQRATGTQENRANENGTDEDEKKTGLTLILQRERWRNMVTYSGTIAELSLKDLDFDYLADSRHFHLSSLYLQRALLPDVGELFRRLKAKGLSISLDTNDDPEDLWDGGLKDLLKHVDILLPNEREAAKITGIGDVEMAVKRLAEMVPLVVVKLGSKGALAQRGKERFTSPAPQVTAVDAVGAGDSFDAGFLNQYLLGADLTTCLASGNLAGALSVTRPGGTEAFRDKEYREKFLREHGVR
jgi:sugar/nucleoside kinase (ribokinase family)